MSTILIFSLFNFEAFVSIVMIERVLMSFYISSLWLKSFILLTFIFISSIMTPFNHRLYSSIAHI
jgi:hypothetical protein